MTPATVPAASGSIAVTVDPSGKYAYVANLGNSSVSEYTIGATGALTAIAGSPVTAGSGADSVTVDPSGRYAYVANFNAHTVSAYSIASNGALSPIHCSGTGCSGTDFAVGAGPNAVTVDPSGHYVYVANTFDNTVSQYLIAPTGALTRAGAALTSTTVTPPLVTTQQAPVSIAMVQVTTPVTYQMGGAIQGSGTAGQGIAGFALKVSPYITTSSAAVMTTPYGVTTDGTNLYAADNNTGNIDKIDANGTVTTIASDGNYPWGITTDGTNLYVTDQGGSILKVVISTGAVTTLETGLQGPEGITTDGTNLYVADSAASQDETIRQIVITPGPTSGPVTLIAGHVGNNSLKYLDGTGAAAQFEYPAALTTDGTNLYVADSGNDAIRQIVIKTGVVTTIAGAVPDGGGITVYSGYQDGTGPSPSPPNGTTGSLFYYPMGITTDGTNLYVADSVNHVIRKIPAH